MDSVTKTKLSTDQIMSMVIAAFGQDTLVKKITELTDGYFNTAYRIDILDGPSTVLKVSPKNHVQVLRYEQDLMAAEAIVLEQVKDIMSIPAPQILYFRKAGGDSENDFLFMAFVSGIPLDKQRALLTESQSLTTSTGLGVIAKNLNAIQGSFFGHVTQFHKQFTNWPDAFLFMIKELLADAADADVALPYDGDAILRMVEAYRDVLAVVTSPSLVHKDLWPGNIFVHSETAHITGIIDFERAVYGDALLEPVCGFLLEDEAFMTAYLGRTELTRDENIRVTLYKIYLFLIMVIECSYRHYSDNGQEVWARERLNESFESLAGYGAAL